MFTDYSVKLYADDTLFDLANSSIDMVSWALNHDLTNVSSWLRANKLSLHIGKTSSMLISSKPKTQNPDLNLNLDDTNINQVKSFKYLGITLDSQLKFSEQFDSTYSKLKRAIGIFGRAAKFLPASACITLYNTLILPRIDYCSTV